MKLNRRTVCWAALAPVLCVLAACSSAPEEASSLSASPAELTVLWDRAVADDVMRSQVEAGQLAIRECMLQEGFEYEALGSLDALPLAEAQFVATGVADIDQLRESGFGLHDQFLIAVDSLAAVQITDPNSDFLASLSGAAHEQYLQAMYGDLRPSEGDSFVPTEGCAAEGFTESLRTEQLFDEFGDDLAATRVRIAADPKLVIALREWSTCMSAAGYRYSDIADMTTSIEGEYDALARQVVDAGLGDDGLNAESSAELERLHGSEQRLADQHAACGAPYFTAYHSLETAARASFIARSDGGSQDAS